MILKFKSEILESKRGISCNFMQILINSSCLIRNLQYCNVTLFCHSVILYFLFIISAAVAHIQFIFHNYNYGYFIEITRSSLNLFQVRWFLTYGLELRDNKIIICAKKCKTEYGICHFGCLRGIRAITTHQFFF